MSASPLIHIPFDQEEILLLIECLEEFILELDTVKVSVDDVVVQNSAEAQKKDVVRLLKRVRAEYVNLADSSNTSN